MRERILVGLLFISSLFIIQHVKAQAFLGVLAFGGNLTQVDGDEMYGFKKIGFNVGVAAIYPFNDKWSLSIEASFAQKGSYQKYPPDNTGKELPYYDLRLNYLDVPVLMHFTDKGFLNFGLGLSWGRLVGVKEVEWGETVHSSTTNSPYSDNDINGIVSVQIPIYKRLKFNFRYSYSFASIRTRAYSNISGDTWTRQQYNNILTFRVVYVFNEKIVEGE
ncbi:MAG: PorT family protein [Bacteroidales bacterium]|nr:PorT family protein [Bacteroidales bacterium]